MANMTGIVTKTVTNQKGPTMRQRRGFVGSSLGHVFHRIVMWPSRSILRHNPHTRPDSPRCPELVRLLLCTFNSSSCHVDLARPTAHGDDFHLRTASLSLSWITSDWVFHNETGVSCQRLLHVHLRLLKWLGGPSFEQLGGIYSTRSELNIHRRQVLADGHIVLLFVFLVAFLHHYMYSSTRVQSRIEARKSWRASLSCF